MPVPRRCSGCGAALGDPTDDDLAIVCRFCGLRHDLNALAADGAPVVVQISGPRRGASKAVLAVVLAVVIVPTAVGLYLADRATTEVTTLVRETTDAVRQRVADRNRPLALTELDTLTEYAWKVVDAAPPPGGVSSFDPVAALPWAMSIAHAWAPDAVLTRIDVGRVSSTGVVDLTGDTPSGYRFHSPARLLRWKQESDGGTKSTTASGLLLQVQGTAVRVLMETSARKEPATPAPASLRLPDLLTKARTGRGFSDRPFYAGYMIFLPREGWAWYFRAPSGDSFPRVRAKDGRVYPY